MESVVEGTVDFASNSKAALPFSTSGARLDRSDTIGTTATVYTRSRVSAVGFIACARMLVCTAKGVAQLCNGIIVGAYQLSKTNFHEISCVRIAWLTDAFRDHLRLLSALH